MNIFDLLRTMPAVALFAAASFATPAQAVTTAGETTYAPYVAAFSPVFGPAAVPYVGKMLLVMHDGTIQGSYTGISVRPDPLNNRIEPVEGASIATTATCSSTWAARLLLPAVWRPMGRSREPLGTTADYTTSSPNRARPDRDSVTPLVVEAGSLRRAYLRAGMAIEERQGRFEIAHQ